jgi:hypothetical protein
VLRHQLVEDSVAHAFRMIDHLVWRLAQLLTGVLLLAALLAWLVLRTGRMTFGVSGGRSAGETQS